MARRGSSIFTPGAGGQGGGQPMAGGIGLVDFDDSDYESEEESPQAPAPKPANGSAPGGPNHRPLVGGFAAAAYEAAKAQHYAEQQKKQALAQKQAASARQSGRK